MSDLEIKGEFEVNKEGTTLIGNHGYVKEQTMSLLNLNLLREDILNFVIDKYIGDKRIKFFRIFGSSASKEYTKFSDVDLLLVVDDNFINEFKKEIIMYLSQNRKYLWYWAYSSNHFYVVFDQLIPLDLYIVSEREAKEINAA